MELTTERGISQRKYTGGERERLQEGVRRKIGMKKKKINGGKKNGRKRFIFTL